MPVARKVWQLAATPNSAWRIRRLTIRKTSTRFMRFGVTAPPLVIDRQRGGALLAGDPGGLEVGIQVLLGVMVSGDLVELAALFVGAEPPELALLVVVLDVHGDDGADPGEGIDHGGQQRPVADPGGPGDVDRVEPSNSGSFDFRSDMDPSSSRWSNIMCIMLLNNLSQGLRPAV